MAGIVVDVDEFCLKNRIDDGVKAEIKALTPEMQQKVCSKLGNARRPNRVVKSRLRNLTQGIEETALRDERMRQERREVYRRFNRPLDRETRPTGVTDHDPDDAQIPPVEVSSGWDVFDPDELTVPSSLSFQGVPEAAIAPERPAQVPERQEPETAPDDEEHMQQPGPSIQHLPLLRLSEIDRSRCRDGGTYLDALDDWQERLRVRHLQYVRRIESMGGCYGFRNFEANTVSLTLRREGNDSWGINLNSSGLVIKVLRDSVIGNWNAQQLEMATRLDICAGMDQMFSINTCLFHSFDRELEKPAGRIQLEFRRTYRKLWRKVLCHIRWVRIASVFKEYNIPEREYRARFYRTLAAMDQRIRQLSKEKDMAAEQTQAAISIQKRWRKKCWDKMLKEQVEKARSENETLCCICYARRPESVFMDCRHLTCCLVCSETVDQCPICRQPISDRVRVYSS